MNTTAKIQHKGQVTIPTSVRRQAGLSKGDLANFAFQRGKIVITPRLVIDRAQFPNADAEYTPAQRRIVDARLDKAEEDLKKGRGFGPFSNAEEMIAHMKGQLKQRAAAKKTGRGRLSQRHGLRQHSLSNPGTEPTFGDNIHGRVQQGLKIEQKATEVEQRSSRFQVDQEIDVTAFVVVSRATDPKTRTLRAPRCAATNRISSRLPSRSSWRVMEPPNPIVSRRGGATRVSGPFVMR